LKNKKDILSRYYYAVCLYKCHKYEQASVVFLSLLETFKGNLSKKEFQDLFNETPIFDEKQMRSSIFYYLGLIY